MCTRVPWPLQQSTTDLVACKPQKCILLQLRSQESEQSHGLKARCPQGWILWEHPTQTLEKRGYDRSQCK